MALQVCAGAQVKCSFGALPSVLNVIPKGAPTLVTGPLAATVMDYTPMANIMPFGLCAAPSNPAVIAATAAALGVFTPMPCIPVTPAPWVPGASTVLINNFPALSSSSSCTCTWGGMITIINAGQSSMQIP